MADERPHDSAMDYYQDNERDYFDSQTTAMLAVIDAVIDHRKAVEAEAEETREELRYIASAIGGVR